MTGLKPVNKWPIRIGGLMRCCTETLRNSIELAREGHILRCLHCPGSMRLREGAWEWDHD